MTVAKVIGADNKKVGGIVAAAFGGPATSQDLEGHERRETVGEGQNSVQVVGTDDQCHRNDTRPIIISDRSAAARMGSWPLRPAADPVRKADWQYKADGIPGFL